MKLDLEQIARVAHEVNRAYCLSLGYSSQLPWEESQEQQRASVRAGVGLHLLPSEQKSKDYVFTAVVKALSAL